MTFGISLSDPGAVPGASTTARCPVWQRAAAGAK